MTALRRHAAWALVTLAYLFASPYYERLNNPNENARVWATRAIVEHHVLNIDAVEREWGWVNDKAKNAQHVYSGKAPGTSFLGVPVLWTETTLRRLVGWPSPPKRAATFWLRLWAVKLPIALFLWFFARYVERVTGSALARDLLVVALGLGTLMYPYGGLYVGHALAAATAFGAFMAIDWRTGRGGRARAEEVGDMPAWRPAIAGFLAGMTVLFEYQAALVTAALTVYVLVEWRHQLRRVLVFLAGALPPAIGLGAYHAVVFGRPWRFPFGNVENPVFAQTAHSAGFHGLAWPHPDAFGAFLFSPAYGLFAFSPALAVGLGLAVALVAIPRDSAPGSRGVGVLILSIAAVMFLFLAGMSNWRAGWCVGPRYITTVAPFLILAIALGWHWLTARWWRVALVVGLVIPSAILNVVSGALYPHYPEQFDNPVFDLAFPLMRDGYVPYGAGWWLHLPGGWSWLPLGVVVTAALALALAGDDERPRRWGAQVSMALGVASLFLLALSAYGRQRRPEEEKATATVRALWDPPRAAVPRRPAAAATGAGARRSK